jgi:hypothetical protein
VILIYLLVCLIYLLFFNAKWAIFQLQYSLRHTMINHCDRRITHLSDTDISFVVFNIPSKFLLYLECYLLSLRWVIRLSQWFIMVCLWLYCTYVSPSKTFFTGEIDFNNKLEKVDLLITDTPTFQILKYLECYLLSPKMHKKVSK